MSATPDPSIRVERKVRLLLLALSLLLSACAEGPTPAPTANPPARRASPVEHLIIIGFDNTHWQDDLQKMPHLLAFFKNGAVLRNSHTGLVSHTATAFLSIITGQYAEKTGILNNTFFDGGKAASWGFWESETDAGHRLVTTPGPWQAFNQAGLDVGVVGWGDMVLENDREVSKFSSLNNREARAAKDYLGFAVYHKDGTRELGSPNIPWLYEVVGSFPGWARLDPSYALKATYAMQARGVPVTITYIENLHDSQPRGGYDSALAAADKAFDEFFKRLAAIGITPANTLFVFTTDEEDTYIAGGVKTLSLQAWLADNPTFKLPASEMLTAGDASLLAYLKDEATLPRVL
ncbi:MAG: alkaline phosphatase family protein, partial [Chloroflexi bacterium]|nr:alkaline phosphatase family protein [Chloroflexota bacterium]